MPSVEKGQKGGIRAIWWYVKRIKYDKDSRTRKKKIPISPISQN
jgi:hypothetical protein